MKYQKLGSTLIYPLILRQEGERSAFEMAQRFYAKHSKKNFMSALCDYMENGFVIARPHLFAMGKPIAHPNFKEGDQRRGWFVEFMVGDMLEMLHAMPCKLDFIAFCRDDDDNLRVVELDAFAKMLTRKLRMT